MNNSVERAGGPWSVRALGKHPSAGDENSELTPYYKQLVANDQDGISMLSIMESELAYWQDEQTKALMAYTASAYEEVPAVTFAEAIALHEQYPVLGSAECVLGLRVANGDLAGARTQVNAVLAGPHDTWWDVQDLWLAQLEDGADPDILTAGRMALLEQYAAGDGSGATAASAWLAALGAPLQTHIVLPSHTRAFHAGGSGTSAAMDVPLLNMLPNPTAGEAYVSVSLPEGYEVAELALFDATGRKLWSKRLGGLTGLEQIPEHLLRSGLYQVVLSADGYTIGTAKLIVTR